MKLSTVQKDAINLIVRSKDSGEGWRQCAPRIYAVLVKSVPRELVETDDQSLRLRLTAEGEAVAKWAC